MKTVIGMVISIDGFLVLWQLFFKYCMLDLEDCCWWIPHCFILYKYPRFKQLFLPRSSSLMPQGFKALPSLRGHPDRGAAVCWWDLMCRLQECDSLRALRTQEERLWVISAKSSVQPAAAAFHFTVHPPLTASITHYPPSQPASISMLRTLTSTLAY